MGFIAGTSLKALPGVRLAVSAKGIDDGARLSRSLSPDSTFRSRSTQGGQVGWATWAAMKAAAGADAVPGAALNNRPGLLAPKWEKELHKALVEAPDVAQLKRVGDEFEQARPLAILFEALWEAIPAGNTQHAIDALNWLSTSGYDPAKDPFVRAYLPKTGYALSIAYGVDVLLDLDRDYIELLLAELYQINDQVEAAEQVLEQLTPTTIAAVSLAEFYLNEGRWADVADLTGNLKVEDEASIYLLIQRGIALREQGALDASQEAFDEALNFLDATTEFGQRALVERGLAFFKEGKVPMARQELEHVLAINETHPGLRNYLGEH